LLGQERDLDLLKSRMTEKPQPNKKGEKQQQEEEEVE